VPLWGASSRVTISSPPVTGSRVISGFSGTSPPFRATLRIASYPRLQPPLSFPLPLRIGVGRIVALDALVAQRDPASRGEVGVAEGMHLAYEGDIYAVVEQLYQLIRRRPGEAEGIHLAHVVRVYPMTEQVDQLVGREVGQPGLLQVEDEARR